MRTLARGLAFLALLAALAAAAPRLRAAAQPKPSSCNITTANRIVAVGDVHGAFDKYVSILREAQLIDSRRRWIGGNAILVQVGDLLDRGPDSRQALDLIRRLEGDSARAGGGVLFLLGNHELMRMAGDYRYVSPGEYAAFKTGEAGDLRERLYERASADGAAQARAKNQPFDLKAFRADFLDKIPLGSVEMQLAFSENGEYGRWLRDHDVMARINDTVFVHGGPGPQFAAAGCEGTNARVHNEMRALNLNAPDRLQTFVWSPDGPLWNRSLVTDAPAGASEGDVTAVLKSLGGARLVVGHTATGTGHIRSLFDGRVIQIDTGMLGGKFFPGGAASALEIQDGKFTAIYEGKREVLR